MSLFTGLQAFWRFVSNSVDSVGAGHNGTDTGITYGADGAIFSTASSSKITITPIDLTALPNFSFAFQFKPDAVASMTGQQDVFSNNNGAETDFGLIGSTSTSANPRAVNFVYGYAPTSGGPAPLTPGVTHHMVFTRDSGTNWTWYIDGTLFATNTGWTPYLGTAMQQFGQGASGAHQLNGALKYCGLWNRVLSGAEVTTLAAAPDLFLVPPSSLLLGIDSYYPFDGSPVDVAGVNTSTNVGSPTYPTGKINQGLSNNGNNTDYVSSSVNIGNGGLGPWTFSGWIKRTGAVTTYAASFAVNASNFTGLYVNPSNLVSIYGAGDIRPGTGVIPLNTWKHVVVTYDSTTVRFYVDGAAAGSWVGTVGGGNTFVNSFAANNSIWGAFPGLVDEYGFWTRVITPTEIATLYNSGAGLAYPFVTTPPPTVLSISPTAGLTAGGTPVTITGTDFITGATVTIGGVSATSVVFVSSTTLTAVTPAGTGTVDVVVTNPDAQFSTLVSAFTYFAAPPVMVPTFGDVNGGTPFIILNSTQLVTSKSDTFKGGSLDAAKWTNTSASGGTVSDSGMLIMTVPTTGGTTRISSVWSAINADVAFTFTNQRNNSNRLTNFTRLQLSLVSDVPTRANYFCVRSFWDTVYGESVAVIMCKASVETVLGVLRVVTPPQSIRIRRVGGRILVNIDSTYTLAYDGWVGSAAQVEISASSAASNLYTPHVITSNNFKVSPIVMFGNAFADATYELNTRIGGVTPANILPVAVPVIIYGLSATNTVASPFQYTPDAGLSIGSSGTVIVDNDHTLRN